MNRRGLTLLEVVLVMGIIVVLAGLLYPTIGRAMATAKAASTISNIQQLSKGVVLYAADVDGRMLAATNYGVPAANVGRLWTSNLSGVVRDSNVFLATGVPGRFAEKWDDRGWASIGMNAGTSVNPKGCAATVADATGCLGFREPLLLDEVAPNSVIFATTPAGPTDKRYRGYEFEPNNGDGDPRDPASPPLVSDADLVAALPELPAELLRPVLGTYGNTGKDDGLAVVGFPDGRAKAFTVNQILSPKVGLIWRLHLAPRTR
ncbi:MAG: type II secretion system protein [Fimbriimonadaceae bacterium]|nr:type II secretion system protein [Fimbriimonadaceae bacterium]